MKIVRFKNAFAPKFDAQHVILTLDMFSKAKGMTFQLMSVGASTR
jgi:hypothetical protein